MISCPIGLKQAKIKVSRDTLNVHVEGIGTRRKINIPDFDHIVGWPGKRMCRIQGKQVAGIFIFDGGITATTVPVSLNIFIR